MTSERSATIVITMAGFGVRFSEAGFRCPKYMIEARGRTLFDWSVGSLAQYIRAGSPFVFVVRRVDETRMFIRERARTLGIAAPAIIELNAPTNGQATTARIACECVDPDAPFAIYNIDTAIDPGFLAPGDAKGDGFIPCFDAPGEGWSFVRLDCSGRALEVREKQRISRHATVGFYWFRSARLYMDAFERYYVAQARFERGERFVAPLYNQMITDGCEVAIGSIPIEAVWPIGTPAELAEFLSHRHPDARLHPGEPAPMSCARDHPVGSRRRLTPEFNGPRETHE
jgi:NDP-sugar pyrophosphorylase family protein